MTNSFLLYNCKLHVFNFDSDEKEIDLSDDTVLQVIFAFIVLEFNVKAFFNTDLNICKFNIEFVSIAKLTSILRLPGISSSLVGVCTEKSNSLVILDAYCL